VNYRAEVIEEIDHGKGYWNTLKIGIFLDDEQIGEYERNYSSLFHTFCPFRQGNEEQWYALYSKSYTCTRLMTLPDCEDIGGEEENEWGFCPVDFYVPHKEFMDYEFEDDRQFGPEGMFGFVAGCIWGDDSSWKIQYLDLSKVKEGILKREEGFGYISLLRGVRLKDAVDMSDYFVGEIEVDGEMEVCDDKIISIACSKMYDLSGDLDYSEVNIQ